MTPRIQYDTLIEARVGPSERAMRFNDGKLQWSLVDFNAFEPMVRVLEFGAKKYSPNNWKKGLGMDKIMESMLRHCFAILEGQELDPESGLPHIGHIMCNAMFYGHFLKKKLHESNENKSQLP